MFKNKSHDSMSLPQYLHNLQGLSLSLSSGVFLIALFNGHCRADGLEDCPTAVIDITDYLTTPVLALDPILVLCFLLHKAV